MNVILENEYLKIAIKSKGAELYSVIRKDNQLEYMWSGDPAIWGKTSPILFPIVGTLKNDSYIFMDESYKLSRHGFARDAEFEIVEQEQHSVVFLLEESSDSLKNYPFTLTFL